MKQHMGLRRAAALGGSVAVLMAGGVLGAGPAAAVDGSVYGRVYTYGGREDPGTAGGSVSAFLDFKSQREVWITDVVLNDICPGDGRKVYWQFGVRMMDGTSFYTETKHWSEGECESAKETWDKLTFTTDLYQIDNAYLKVCVDEPWYVAGGDDCEKTNERDNPYTGAS